MLEHPQIVFLGTLYNIDRTPPKTTLDLHQDTFFLFNSKKNTTKNYKFKSEK